MTPGSRSVDEMSRRTLIEAYFAACSHGTPEDVAACFTADAMVFDTNIAPFTGAGRIGRQWVRVRERWGGAVWTVDSCVESESGEVAAIEWSMSGTEPTSGRAFIFRGSEHYRFEENLIVEIRQYWTFNPNTLDTALLGYLYPADAITPRSAPRNGS
jgi:ketosteroid isomerase-like protein